MVAGTQLCFALDKVSQIPTTSQHNPENGLLGGVGHYVLLWTLPLSNKNADTLTLKIILMARLTRRWHGSRADDTHDDPLTHVVGGRTADEDMLAGRVGKAAGALAGSQAAHGIRRA